MSIEPERWRSRTNSCASRPSVASITSMPELADLEHIARDELAQLGLEAVVETRVLERLEHLVIFDTAIDYTLASLVHAVRRAT